MKYHYRNHCFTKEIKRKRENIPLKECCLYFERINMEKMKRRRIRKSIAN